MGLRVDPETERRILELAGLAASAPHKLGLTKPAKYRNRKVKFGGAVFDSEKEFDRYMHLRRAEHAGQIQNLERQVTFPFVINGVLVCEYRADAVYEENGVKVVEDTKSEVTRKLPLYRVKRKLMKAVYGVDIREV